MGKRAVEEWDEMLNRVRCPSAKNQVQCKPETTGGALTAHKGILPDWPEPDLLPLLSAETVMPTLGRVASAPAFSTEWADRAAGSGLNLHAGRPPALSPPARPLPPVFSDGALLSVLLPTWFLLSGRAGAPPAPAVSPTECDSWQL